MPPFFLLLLLPFLHSATPAGAGDICVVGSGISGASHRGRVGGRLATVTVAGDEFEAGGSIIHPRNLHVRRFADLLGLAGAAKTAGDDDWLGIWDGARFVFKTLRPPPPGSFWLRRKLHGLANSLLLLRRYGLSLLRMDSFVQEMLQMFMPYSMDLSPGWSGLYGLTRRALEEELVDAGFNSQTISELVTVITRINYG